jgi:tRNA 2-thiouridine synthesizing protein D
MVENPKDEAKTITIILTEGPYRSQYVEIAHNIAESALDCGYNVNLFLYMDATHIPKKNQNPHSFPNVGQRLKHLIDKGAVVRACVRCATARGHACDKKSYLKGVSITSVYDVPGWVRESDKIITLSG